MIDGAQTHVRMLGPVHQIPRRKRVEKDLLVIRRGVRRKDPVLVLEDPRFRVRVPSVEDGIRADRGAHRSATDEQAGSGRGGLAKKDAPGGAPFVSSLAGHVP